MGRSIYSIDAWMIGRCETPTARHPTVFGLRWGSQHSADNMQQTTCDAQRTTCDGQHATDNMRRATDNMQRTTCNGQHAADNMRRAADSFPAARGGQAGGGARVAGRAEEEVLRLPLLCDGSAHFGAGRATRNAQRGLVGCANNGRHRRGHRPLVLFPGLRRCRERGMHSSDRQE
jgi:hypothetical protein